MLGPQAQFTSISTTQLYIGKSLYPTLDTLYGTLDTLYDTLDTLYATLC